MNKNQKNPLYTHKHKKKTKKHKIGNHNIQVKYQYKKNPQTKQGLQKQHWDHFVLTIYCWSWGLQNKTKR